MIKLIIFVLLSASFSLFAGDKVGNGGDVIVCPDQRTIILDLHQGQVDWGFHPSERKGTRPEVMAETLEEFTAVDSFIAGKILKRALEIDREMTASNSKLVKLTENELVNISDEGVAELPAGCKIVQAATQIQSPFPGEVKFTFQKAIWESLDTDVQASLILHEVIYEHMISVGEGSSRSTRYLNAALHSGHLTSVKNYFDVSSLFLFRNLSISDDGTVRKFGSKKVCSVKRARYRPGNGDVREATTVIVGQKNILTKEENFQKAIELFWKKYVTEGECD